MVTFLVMAGVILGVLCVVPLLGRSMATSKGRGGAISGAFGVFEELFHPSADRAGQVIEQQKERKDALPTPDDDTPGQAGTETQ